MKGNNKWLVVSVVIIAIMSLGAYVANFWEWPISKNTKHWADFAVYVSGTVGVAAVVATLVAFVKTLGQQQELIDSQEKMLEEQKRQINITKKQSDELKNKHAVDVAYSSTGALFLDFAASFEKSLSQGIPILTEQKRLARAFEELDYSDNFLRETLIKNPGKLYPVLSLAPFQEVDEFVVQAFSSIGRLYIFMVRQIESAPELRDYFDNYLNHGGDVKNVFYLHCYQAYLVGKGRQELYEKGVSCLGLKSEYGYEDESPFNWQDIGGKLRDGLEKSR